MKILVILPGAQGVYPPEAEHRRIDVCRSYATPTTQVDVDFPAEPSGFGPMGGGGGALEMARNHILVAERMVQAEKEGYDAVVPFGMIDFGVELARTRVNIPVVGQARAAYCMAAQMADRIGVITYQSNSHNRMWAQLREYGFTHLVVGFGASEMSNAEMPKQRQLLYERFVSEGQRLVKAGAELIVCHGMSMSPVEYRAEEYAAGIGVPVLEGMGCAISTAEAWHRMGTPYSRIRYPQGRAAS